MQKVSQQIRSGDNCDKVNFLCLVVEKWQPCRKVIIIPIVLIKKLRSNMAKWFVHGLPAGEQF